MDNERAVKRDALAPEKARALLKAVREIFAEQKLDVLLFGSRTRNSHTVASDFDISIVKTMPDSTTDEEMKQLYAPYYRYISDALHQHFHNISTPARAMYLRTDDGHLFSFTPKFRRAGDTRNLMHLDMKGVWRTNDPVHVMQTSKSKDKQTDGRFSETLRYIKQKLDVHSFKFSYFIIASLVSHVEDTIFMTHDNIKDRTRAVLEWLLKEMKVRYSSEWHSMDKDERIFVTQPEAYEAAKKCISILLEDLNSKTTT